MRFAPSMLACAAALCVASSAVTAQEIAPSMTRPVAAVTPAPVLFSSSASVPSDLPDAPESNVALVEGQAGNGGAPSNEPVAPKYSTTILPGQTALPLSGGQKVTFAIRDAISPFSFLSMVISATYSQGVDSQPHYGQGWGPYGQRIGAAAARSTVQTLASEAVFAPLFRDDPRYYVLGRRHKFLNRVIYSATRVVITRGDNGKQRVNAPLLLGYAAAAGANFAYYPERDRDFHHAATGYAGSLGGAVLGMEVNEFIDDALRIAHLRH